MTMLLAAWLSIAAVAPSGGPAEVATPSITAAQPVVLHVDAADYEPLREALEARLPAVAVHPHRASVLEALRGRELLYAELAPGPPGELRLVVILHDGRSFERTFAVDEADRVHSIATTLANTIAAIREERIEPTQTHVAIPEAAPEPATTPMPAPTTTVRATETTPRPPIDTPPPATIVPTPTVRRIELGLAPYGGAAIVLGPHGVAPAVGIVGLDVDLRLPGGALVAVGGRYGTRATEDARVHRIAVSLEGGYDLRRRDFELRLAAGLVVEPWLVSRAGRRQSLRDDDGDRTTTPVLAGRVGVAPGWYWRRSPQSNVALRLGLRAQMQFGALVTGGMARLKVGEGTNATELATLGGAELSFGLDTTLWFTLRRKG